jgi:hypothetical protein
MPADALGGAYTRLGGRCGSLVGLLGRLGGLWGTLAGVSTRLLIRRRQRTKELRRLSDSLTLGRTDHVRDGSAAIASAAATGNRHAPADGVDRSQEASALTAPPSRQAVREGESRPAGDPTLLVPAAAADTNDTEGAAPYRIVDENVGRHADHIENPEVTHPAADDHPLTSVRF